MGKKNGTRKTRKEILAEKNAAKATARKEKSQSKIVTSEDINGLQKLLSQKESEIRKLEKEAYDLMIKYKDDLEAVFKGNVYEMTGHFVSGEDSSYLNQKLRETYAKKRKLKEEVNKLRLKIHRPKNDMHTIEEDIKFVRDFNEKHSMSEIYMTSGKKIVYLYEEDEEEYPFEEDYSFC